MENKIKFQILCLLSFIIYFKIIKCLDELEGKCSKEVHEECSDRYVPTERELDRARDYIQKLFIEKSSYPPDTTKIKPCPKIYARRNFKCISHKDRLILIEAFKKLYQNGVMWKHADAHGRCWPAYHKSGEGITGHRIVMNKVEQAIMKVDSRVIIPYWNIAEDCDNPERSLIWKYFGTCGTSETDWCVTDGPFTNVTQTQCIKREWNSDGTIPPWYCPDIANIHLSPPLYAIFYLITFLNLHFRPHISIGGNNGHYSQPWAPYDAIFPIHHLYTDCTLIQNQLSYDVLLTPPFYNSAFSFDQTTHQTNRANIEQDIICHYNESVLKWTYIGFGDNCIVCDFIIKAINEKLDNEDKHHEHNVLNEAPRLTTTVNDVLDSIEDPSQPLRENQNWEPLLIFNPKTQQANLSGCNPKCWPMPFPQKFSETPEGQRQINAFRNDWGVDTYPLFYLTGLFLRGLLHFFNLMGHCSPYVTSMGQTNTSDYQFGINDLHDVSSIKIYLKSIFIRFKIALSLLLKKLNLQ